MNELWSKFVRMFVILALLLTGAISTAGPASASAPVLLSGTQWLAGTGVNVCDGSTDPYCGTEYKVGSYSANWWQCVELAQRLYQKKGWHSGTFGVSFAYQIYDVANSIGMSRQANGSITSIVPGDMIIHNSSEPYSGGAGHVSIVDTVSGSTVNVVEQNTYNDQPRGSYTLSNGTLSRPGSTIRGVVHDPANTSGHSIANGTYVKTTTSGAVYVTAGGAAISVPSWESVGGIKPVVTISQTQLDTMTYYPKDGTYVTDYGSSSVYVIAGGAYFYVSSWAVVGGVKPTTMLPFNTIGTKFRQYPFDGTYVKDYGSSSVAVIAGGAAITVPSWESVGGIKPVAEIPSGSLSVKFRQYPVDGTYVADYGSPSVYVVAGGAGLYVTGWEAVGGPRPTTVLPASSVGIKLRSYPLDGTYVRGYATGKIYMVQDGTTAYVSSWGPAGPQPFTDIDQWAITNQLDATG